MRRAVIKPVNDRPLVDSPRNFFIAITFGFFFLLLVTLIGFYTSSLLVLLTLPIALGFRRAVPLVLSATLFIVFLYVLFSLVLERPLPREFFQI
jgi:dolichyl-phosphate-mannose--protein O-mannosyl transferase